MEPPKKCDFVPKMIYFTKRVKNLKWEPARFLRVENMGNHMEPSKISSFCSKNGLFPKWTKDLKMGTS